VEQVTVLLIQESAAEAALMAAALALRPGVRVVDVPDAREADTQLESASRVVLAFAGTAAVIDPPTSLLRRLEVQGIPVVGVAAGLSEEEKRRALAAGVVEVHDRPAAWRAYADLIESVATRFIRP
jgi:hypothetical protein